MKLGKRDVNTLILTSDVERMIVVRNDIKITTISVLNNLSL